MVALSDIKKMRKDHAHGSKDDESVVLKVAAMVASMAAQ